MTKNQNLYNVKTIIAIILLVNVNSLYGQHPFGPFYRQYSGLSCPYDSASLQLELLEDTIGVIDILRYKVTFTNEATTSKEFMQPWGALFEWPLIELRYETDSVWKELPLSNYGAVPLEFSRIECGFGELPARKEPPVFRSNYISLKGGEQLSKTFSWAEFTFLGTDPLFIHIDKDLFKNNFSSVGKYFVRASIKECSSPKIALQSKEVVLYVLPYEGTDEAAKNWLSKELYFPALIFSPGIGRPGGSFYNALEGMEDTKKFYDYETIFLRFIQLFPDSSFTPWVQLCLAYWYNYPYKIIINADGKTTYERRHGPPRTKEMRVLIKAVRERPITGKETLSDKAVREAADYLWSQLKPEK